MKVPELLSIMSPLKLREVCVYSKTVQHLCCAKRLKRVQINISCHMQLCSSTFLTTTKVGLLYQLLILCIYTNASLQCWNYCCNQYRLAALKLLVIQPPVVGALYFLWNSLYCVYRLSSFVGSYQSSIVYCSKPKE